MKPKKTKSISAKKLDLFSSLGDDINYLNSDIKKTHVEAENLWEKNTASLFALQKEPNKGSQIKPSRMKFQPPKTYNGYRTRSKPMFIVILIIVGLILSSSYFIISNLLEPNNNPNTELKPGDSLNSLTDVETEALNDIGKNDSAATEENSFCAACPSCKTGFGRQVKQIIETDSEFETKYECKECLFSTDCIANYHCCNNKCIPNSILESKKDCVNLECTEPCDSCISGTFVCQLKRSDSEKDKCVECRRDSDCKSGYVCDKYLCI